MYTPSRLFIFCSILFFGCKNSQNNSNALDHQVIGSTKLVFHNSNPDTVLKIGNTYRRIDYNCDWFDTLGTGYYYKAYDNDTIIIPESESYKYDSIIEIRIKDIVPETYVFFIKKGSTNDIYYDSIGVRMLPLGEIIESKNINYEYYKRKEFPETRFSHFSKYLMPLFLNNLPNGTKLQFEIAANNYFGSNLKGYQSDIKFEKHVLDSLLYCKSISPQNHKRYLGLLEYKMDILYINWKLEDNLYPKENETGMSFIKSNFYKLASSKSILDKVLSYDFLIKNANTYIIQRDKGSGGSNPNYLDLMDTINALPFDLKTKKILLNINLNNSLRNAKESVRITDYKLVTRKYLDFTHDSSTLNHYLELNDLLDPYSPNLTLEDNASNTITWDSVFKRNKGKVIYVDFWASWCKPCRKSLSASTALRNKYFNMNMEFIYLALNDKKRSWKEASQKEGLDTLPLNYFILNSKSALLLSDLKINSVPRYVIFDQTGHLINSDAPSPEDPELNSLLDQLLFKKQK